MSKGLHDIDDFFRSALDGNEETPSAGVKERLEAALNKKGAKFFRKKFSGWKKTTLLFLLILPGFALYDSVILNTGTGHSGGRTADNQKHYSYRENSKKTSEKHIATDRTNNDENNIAVPAATGRNSKAGFEESASKTKGIAQKNIPREKSYAGKNRNILEDNIDLLSKERTIAYRSLKEINIVKSPTALTIAIKPLQTVNSPRSKNRISENPKQTKGKIFKPFWMIATFASYERAGYRLDSDLPTNITSIKHSEVHEPSFSLGMIVSRQIKKRWALQTGLIYSQTNIGISPQKLDALQDPRGDISFKYITSSGYAYIRPGLGAPPAIGDSLFTAEGKHALKSISVPLLVKYTVVDKTLSFIPGVGIEANYLTSAKVETEVEKPSSPEIIFINKLDGAKSVYLSVVADAELRYKLNDNLSISFRPGIRFAISPVAKNNIVETFPRSIGAGLGLTWKF
ncbi:MAG: outer membrane beta-barrel protein [Chitinophagaceae bacterium]